MVFYQTLGFLMSHLDFLSCFQTHWGQEMMMKTMAWRTHQLRLKTTRFTSPEVCCLVCLVAAILMILVQHSLQAAEEPSG